MAGGTKIQQYCSILIPHPPPELQALSIHPSPSPFEFKELLLKQESIVSQETFQASTTQRKENTKFLAFKGKWFLLCSFVVKNMFNDLTKLSCYTMAHGFAL